MKDDESVDDGNIDDPNADVDSWWDEDASKSNDNDALNSDGSFSEPEVEPEIEPETPDVWVNDTRAASVSSPTVSAPVRDYPADATYA
jgi:hypothetical protein